MTRFDVRAKLSQNNAGGVRDNVIAHLADSNAALAGELRRHPRRDA